MKPRRRPFGVLLAGFIALTPQVADAQPECLAEFKQQTSGSLLDRTTLCRTASAGRCAFEIAVCVNQVDEGCRPLDLKGKRIHARGCPGAQAVRLDARGTSQVCGSFARVTVRTRKHGTKAGQCRLWARVGGKKADVTKIMLRCEPNPDCGVCGNGVTEPPEQCDPPSSPVCSGLPGSPPLPCNADCTCPPPHAVCGNGVVEPGEMCDPPGSPTCPGSLPCEGCLCPELLPSLSFTTVPGTTSCGGAGLSPGAAAPFSGEIFSDITCTTKIDELGRGCLYLGGGNAKAIPPGAVPAGTISFLTILHSNLLASVGTGAVDCTNGAGPAKVCLNDDALPICRGDADCAGYPGACHEFANCFFGPPLALPNPTLPALSTCVLNVFQTDASGTLNAATGESTVTLPLAAEIYVTGNQGSPCPQCMGNRCTYGVHAGEGCSTAASSMTSHNCPPTRGGGAFQAVLGVSLSPLTTGTASLTDAAGNLCASQKTPGAFGVTGVRCVRVVGIPAGDLSDGQPHSGILAAAFCLPATSNTTIDGMADLPGPGLISLPGNVQID